LFLAAATNGMNAPTYRTLGAEKWTLTGRRHQKCPNWKIIKVFTG